MANEWQPDDRRRTGEACQTAINYVSNGADALACARLVVGLGLREAGQGELLWRTIVSRIGGLQNPTRDNFSDLAAYGEALTLLDPN